MLLYVFDIDSITEEFDSLSEYWVFFSQNQIGIQPWSCPTLDELKRRVIVLAFAVTGHEASFPAKSSTRLFRKRRSLLRKLTKLVEDIDVLALSRRESSLLHT